jgi:hypothetical protein
MEKESMKKSPFVLFLFLLFNSCQLSERKKREGKQGMKEGEIILWLILVVTLK